MGGSFLESRPGAIQESVKASRAFQPHADLFDDHVHFVGPSVPQVTTPVAEWLPRGDAPIVYVSLGTIFNERPQVFAACIEALRTEPVRVVLSVGERVSRGALGTLPDNMLIHERVPQVPILQEAALFVTHGGMNSTHEGVLAGVPLLVVPQQNEQRMVARRVVELGLGRQLPSTPSASNIRDSVRALMGDVSVRERLTQVAQTLRAAGGTSRAVDEIEAHLARSTHS